MNLQQCLAYMEQNCPKGTPGGFERTRKLAEIYGNPQENCRTIHVAGTNGKGSTCAMLASILQQAGYRVGLYTSPHLERYEERIKINGEMINEYLFSNILTDLIEFAIPQVVDAGLGHPGEFELLTVAGWIYFADKTDFVVSEVGLGGTLDPTNLIQHPVMTVITTVSLDHTAILGDNLAAIAKEKAGILKKGSPLAVGVQYPEARQAIERVAGEMGIKVCYVEENALEAIVMPLTGYYQQLNGNLALTAIRMMQEEGLITITEEQIREGFARVSWPGRMEWISLGEEKGILLDGAHNPDGIYRLAQNLKNEYANWKIVLFLGILDDKEQQLMIEQIVPLADQVIVSHPEHNKRAEQWLQLGEMVRSVAPECELQAAPDLKEGLKAAVKGLQAGEMLCITGSLYLLGDCRHYLKEMRILPLNA